MNYVDRTWDDTEREKKEKKKRRDGGSGIKLRVKEVPQGRMEGNDRMNELTRPISVETAVPEKCPPPA